MYSVKQEKPSLTIRLKINTLPKSKKDKKQHRKSNRIRKHRKSTDQANSRKTVYWTSERIEPTKFILRTVMIN
ncbi:hypothetical protein A0J61_07959 [Choanephora cucurbitarum]|uniref:Uncharacterized protein n=1 Tax=Choanephora cucurbitarum TaxID=101091 RepID=A0A1C7N4N1_9FUNG|nr:hypothetical protein A0J61_07959 [Choanephora cucurbitarum]